MVQLWDAETIRPVGPMRRHSNAVGAMAFRHDGRLLATGTYHGNVHLWTIESDGAQGENPVMRPVGPAMPQGRIVWALEFSRDGKTLAVGTAEGNPRGEPQIALWDVSDPAAAKLRGTPHRAIGRVTWMRFNADGSRLLANVLHGQLWDTAQPGGPRLMREYPSPFGLVLGEFSPDGKRFLTGSADQTARVWDAATGEPVPGGTLHHPAAVTALVFSPDSALVLVGGADGSARLWDAATSRPLGPPVVHGRPLIGAAFRPDGQTLVTTADDGSCRVW